MSTKIEPKRQVRELTKEELQSLTNDLGEVLKKHNAEMGVTSSINLMKVVEEVEEEVTKTDDNKEEEKTETNS